MLFLDSGITVDMNKLLDQLANYAAPLVKHGWEILVRQQYIQGIQQMIWAVALLIFTIIGYFLGKKLWKWATNVKTSSYNDGAQYIAPIIVWFISVILIFISVGLATDGIAHILNPEYYAVEQIYCSAPGIHCNN